MNLKKIPYYLAVGLLVFGASLTLGLLSFGGMYALFPILGLAFAVFGLSVLYEGEIYLQNIKGALTKLFKTDYLEHTLAKRYLLTQFPKNNLENSPQFFKDYYAQLALLDTFGHKTLDSESKKRKKQVEKTLRDMERWFANVVFKKPAEDNDDSEYVNTLRLWLQTKEGQPDQWLTSEEWQNKLSTRRIVFYSLVGFSIVASGFAALGTSFLLVEAIAVIPWLAALGPGIVVPLAAVGSIIAGVAYGLLVYNAITDFITNETITTWFNKLRKDWNDNGISLRNVIMAFTTTLLVGLAIALTICTAGTWWTAVANARPLFDFMKNIPWWIVSIAQPIVTGIGSLFFIIQNTSESLDMVNDILKWVENAYNKGKLIAKMLAPLSDWFSHLPKIENWFQIFNPFRILLKLIVMPLRILLFLGHLISIALTADRMPGIPQIVSFLVAIISEGFEDAHYFIGHVHNHSHDDPLQDLLDERLDAAHSHNHDTDVPTWILKGLVSPLYLLAGLWDWGFSQLNATSPVDIDDDLNTENLEPRVPKPLKKDVLDFRSALAKQWSGEKEEEVQLNDAAQRPSIHWQKEHTCYLIDEQKAQLKAAWANSPVANDKIAAFDNIQNRIRNAGEDVNLRDLLNAEELAPVLNQQRYGLFASEGQKTKTQEFYEALPNRVNLRAN